MQEFLDKHITKYFHTSDTAVRVVETLLSKNTFKVPVAAIIQCRTGKTARAEHVFTKTQKQLKLKTMDEDAKCVTQKLASPPKRTDLVPSNSLSDKDDYTKTDKCCPVHCSHTVYRQRGHRNDD